MPRKPISDKIVQLNAEIEQKEKELSLLLQQQKEQERKDRTKRLCKRAGFLESLLPETISLTDAQFESYLKTTLKSKFACEELNKLIALNSAVVTAPQSETQKQTTASAVVPQCGTPTQAISPASSRQGNTSAQDGTSAAPKPTATAAQNDGASTQKSNVSSQTNSVSAVSKPTGTAAHRSDLPSYFPATTVQGSDANGRTNAGNSTKQSG